MRRRHRPATRCSRRCRSCAAALGEPGVVRRAAAATSSTSIRPMSTPCAPWRLAASATECGGRRRRRRAGGRQPRRWRCSAAKCWSTPATVTGSRPTGAGWKSCDSVCSRTQLAARVELDGGGDDRRARRRWSPVTRSAKGLWSVADHGAWRSGRQADALAAAHGTGGCSPTTSGSTGPGAAGAGAARSSSRAPALDVARRATTDRNVPAYGHRQLPALSARSSAGEPS